MTHAEITDFSTLFFTSKKICDVIWEDLLDVTLAFFQ